MAKKKARKKSASKAAASGKSGAGKRSAKGSKGAKKKARQPKKQKQAAAPRPIVGSVAWRDLTVKDADRVRDFYSKVVGWKVMGIDMGGYSDYCMIPPASDDPEVGICHKRGVNSAQPSQWIMYVIVADLDDSLRQCKRHGGKQVVATRAHGSSRFAVIKDPAGAMIGLYEAG